jgi:hypothetical protein
MQFQVYSTRLSFMVNFATVGSIRVRHASVNLYKTSTVRSMYMGLSVAQRGFQMQGKPSRCVCEHAIVLTFEFHKIGGAGVHQRGWFFTLNWTNPINYHFSVCSV